MGKIKHGHAYHNAKTLIYLIWIAMKKRCNNPNDRGYKNYGGRGIKVCEAWLSFENFFEDMGERPPNMSLDRVDNNGDYCKENCKWSTRKEQNRNTRRSILITINGEIKSLPEWCGELGVEYNKARKRLYRGWPIEEVFGFTEHVHKHYKYFTWNNMTLTMKDWCRQLNLKYTTIMMRIRSGRTPE